MKRGLVALLLLQSGEVPLPDFMEDFLQGSLARGVAITAGTGEISISQGGKVLAHGVLVNLGSKRLDDEAHMDMARQPDERLAQTLARIIWHHDVDVGGRRGTFGGRRRCRLAFGCWRGGRGPTR